MRSIKICSALLMMAFSVSCEKESLDPTGNQITVDQDQLTFSEFVNSGIDVEKYLQTVSQNESALKIANKSASETSSIGNEDYTCGSMEVVTEDFEEGRMLPDNAGQFLGPLNEDTPASKFQPGDIQPGISITTITTRTDQKSILALYGQLVRGTYSKVIYSETPNDDLVVDFTTDDVEIVSLDILSFPYPDIQASQEVTVQVIYESGEKWSEDVIASTTGLRWEVTGYEPISQIIISSTKNDAWIGVDNITFGYCDDNDADGCLDGDDAFPGSNMEATVNIGSCDSGVENRLTAECGVSMSDLINVLEADSYRNKGQFVSSVASQTNLWVASGLISELEKDALMSCAAGTDFLNYSLN